MRRISPITGIGHRGGDYWTESHPNYGQAGSIGTSVTKPVCPIEQERLLHGHWTTGGRSLGIYIFPV